MCKTEDIKSFKCFGVTLFTAIRLEESRKGKHARRHIMLPSHQAKVKKRLSGLTLHPKALRYES